MFFQQHCYYKLLLSFIFVALININALKPAYGDNLYDEAKLFKNNVVQIFTTFSDESQESGFGFVIGERDDTLYLLTANHVVSNDKHQPSVTVTTVKASFCASLLEQYPVTISGVTNAEMDYAVLIVSRPYNDYEWKKKYLDLKASLGKNVSLIGRNGECTIPVTTGKIGGEHETRRGVILVDYNKVLPGSSGAPLISETGLVGMIIEDSQDHALALDLATLQGIVKDNGVPFDLEVSPDGDSEVSPDSGLAACKKPIYKMNRGPSCGVEKYKAKASSKCDILEYNTASGSQCGVAQWKHCKSGSCGWNSCGPIAKCSARSCRTTACGVEIYKTCAHPDFGIKSYKICRHPDHGVEVYKACRSPEFGFDYCGSNS